MSKRNEAVTEFSKWMKKLAGNDAKTSAEIDEVTAKILAKSPNLPEDGYEKVVEMIRAKLAK